MPSASPRTRTKLTSGSAAAHAWSKGFRSSDEKEGGNSRELHFFYLNEIGLRQSNPPPQHSGSLSPHNPRPRPALLNPHRASHCLGHLGHSSKTWVGEVDAARRKNLRHVALEICRRKLLGHYFFDRSQNFATCLCDFATCLCDFATCLLRLRHVLAISRRVFAILRHVVKNRKTQRRVAKCRKISRTCCRKSQGHVAKFRRHVAKIKSWDFAEQFLKIFLVIFPAKVVSSFGLTDRQLT